MKLNGTAPERLHRCVSYSGEIMPGGRNAEIVTVETGKGETAVAINRRQLEYVVRLNIAARTYEEAMEARNAIAAWAAADGALTAEAEPTHMPGLAFGVVLKSISAIEKRFGTVDVVFAVPDPYLHSVRPSAAKSTGGTMHLMIGGTANVQPVLTIVPDAAASGMTLTADGKTFVKLWGTVRAGQTVEIAPENGSVTIDGEHAENRIVYTDTDLDKEFAPGRHTIACSVSAAMTARWRDKWQ